MATYKRITTSNTTLLAVATWCIKGFSLIAAGANSILEVFEGAFGKIATIAVGAAGTGYTALDVLTLAQANGGIQATVRVNTVGGSGEVLTVTLLTAGTGYVAGSTYATTGGTGSGATITASTVSETPIGVLKAPATTQRELIFGKNKISTAQGISVKLTGASAEAYLYYN